MLDLTKDRFTKLSCDEVKTLRSFFESVSFVLFASEDELKGGQMTHLNTLASLDSYTNPNEQISWYYTVGQACKREFKHKADEPGVSLFMH